MTFLMIQMLPQVLIAVAKYTDGSGAENNFAFLRSMNTVKEDTRNRMPMFADQDYDAHGVQNTLTLRSVAEDGRFVGRVVMARDPDPNADELVYTLGGDDAALFKVDEHGQITVSGKLDYETRTTYSVTVIGTDSFGVSSSIMVNIMVTDVNEPPVISLGGLAISGLASVDYAENGMDAVETYTAVGPGAASADWTLEGADADIFSISDGVLTFNAMPDYETPADANMNNVYVVRVNANDGTYSDTHDVTVIVTPVDEDGMVTLSSRPVVDTALTASLTDADGGVTGVMWQWASSDAMDGTWTDISGATSDSYTPMAGDAGNYLQATASYTDAIGEDKSAMAVTAEVVDLVGMVTLSSSQPVVDTALTVSLTDPDGDVTGVMWQWASSDAIDGT